MENFEDHWGSAALRRVEFKLPPAVATRGGCHWLDDLPVPLLGVARLSSTRAPHPKGRSSYGCARKKHFALQLDDPGTFSVCIANATGALRLALCDVALPFGMTADGGFFKWFPPLLYRYTVLVRERAGSTRGALKELPPHVAKCLRYDSVVSVSRGQACRTNRRRRRSFFDRRRG